jgi:hypothetical protein
VERERVRLQRGRALPKNLIVSLRERKRDRERATYKEVVNLKI